MPFLQNTFLESPLKHAIALYNHEIIPRLSRRNKAIAITAAITMSFVLIVREKILKPPKKLRHIPYISLFTLIGSLLKGESIWNRSYRVYFPIINSKKGSGLYTEFGRSGWSVHVSDPEEAKKVLLKHDLFPKASKVPLTDTLKGKFAYGPNIVLLNGHEWKSQRKIANPAFHQSAPIKLFGKLTQDLFTAMESMGETVNVSMLMANVALDAIGIAGFDFDFKAVADRNSKWTAVYNSVKGGLEDPLFFLFPILDTKLLWMFPKRQQIHKDMTIFLEMLDEIIKTKRRLLKEGSKSNVLENEIDLLSLMIESEIDGEKMNDTELKSNLCVFFLAGHDTSAGALTFAIHYLAEHQDIQQKAREEVIEILGDQPVDILPSADQLKKMTYLQQIINENLRINGPAVTVLPRITAEDTEISGTFIPKGTVVDVNIFNIQHNDNVWTDSKKFDPERFSEENEKARKAAGQGSSYLPFGGGARKCIGMNFSLNMQRVLLSMMLRKFTWETPEDSKHRNGLITNAIALVCPVDLDITFHKRY